MLSSLSCLDGPMRSREAIWFASHVVDEISWLQLCLPTRAITTVDDPGIWSLLNIRSLRHLTILGPRGCIAPDVLRCLMARTRRETLVTWQYIGLESVGRAYNNDHG